MNLFGEIGNFIIKYQEIIQAAAIIAGIVAVVAIIIKLIRHGKKKTEILSQINTTVSEINTAVNHLQDKKAEVIYIDSRMSSGAGEAGIRELLKETSESAAGLNVADGAAAEADGTDENHVEAAGKEEAEPAEENIEPSLKYFSRDCAVSKTGKRFTYEELDAQIRE